MGAWEAEELDEVLVAELRHARLDFEEGRRATRSRTSSELAGLIGAPARHVMARLVALRVAGHVFEDRLRDRWTVELA